MLSKFISIIKNITILGLLISTSINAAKIERNSLELGGAISGTYTNYQTSKQYSTGLTPLLAYYFSDHWFLEVGLGLSYFYSSSTDTSVSNISGQGGIGFYTRISENVVFAIPLFVDTYYTDGRMNGLSVSEFGPSVNYGIRPTLKFQIGENVNLSPFIGLRAMLVNLKGYSTPSYIYYGMAWTYVW